MTKDAFTTISPYIDRASTLRTPCGPGTGRAHGSRPAARDATAPGRRGRLPRAGAGLAAPAAPRGRSSPTGPDGRLAPSPRDHPVTMRVTRRNGTFKTRRPVVVLRTFRRQSRPEMPAHLGRRGTESAPCTRRRRPAQAARPGRQRRAHARRGPDCPARATAKRPVWHGFSRPPAAPESDLRHPAGHSGGSRRAPSSATSGSRDLTDRTRQAARRYSDVRVPEPLSSGRETSTFLR